MAWSVKAALASVRSGGQFIGRILRWIIAAVLLFLVVRYFQSNPQALQSILSFEIWRIAAAVLLFVLATALHGWRVFLIIKRHAAIPLRYGAWLRLFVEARVLNLIGSQLGNIYRARQMKHKFDVAYTSYASSLGFFIWIDTASNMALTVIVLFYFTMAGSVLPISGGEAILVLILWLSALPAVSLLSRRLNFANTGNRIVRHAGRFLEEFRSAAADSALTIRVLALGLLSFTNLVALNTLVFTGIGAEVALYQVIIIVVLYKLSLIIMLTPGNVGITEWTVAGACLLVGIDVGVGLLVALLMRAFNLLALASMASLIGLERLVRTPA